MRAGRALSGPFIPNWLMHAPPLLSTLATSSPRVVESWTEGGEDGWLHLDVRMFSLTPIRCLAILVTLESRRGLSRASQTGCFKSNVLKIIIFFIIGARCNTLIFKRLLLLTNVANVPLSSIGELKL